MQVELYDAENQPDYCFGRVEAIIRDLTETKGYQYSDIALLTRKSDYGSEMANYLNDKSIPVISQDSILLMGIRITRTYVRWGREVFRTALN